MSWLRINDWGERYIGCHVKWQTGGLVTMVTTGIVKDAGPERLVFAAGGNREHYFDVQADDQLWLDTNGPKPVKVWDSEVKEYAKVLYEARQAKLETVVPKWDDLVATHKEAWYYTASEGLKWADFPGRPKFAAYRDEITCKCRCHNITPHHCANCGQEMRT